MTDIIKTSRGYVYISTNVVERETMVFPCTKNGLVTSWDGLDRKVYGENENMEDGHVSMCARWENK